MAKSYVFVSTKNAPLWCIIGFQLEQANYINKQLAKLYPEWFFFVDNTLRGRNFNYSDAYCSSVIQRLCGYIQYNFSDAEGRLTTPKTLNVLYVGHQNHEKLKEFFFPFGKANVLGHDDQRYSWYKISENAFDVVREAISEKPRPIDFKKTDQKRLPFRNFMFCGNSSYLWDYFWDLFISNRDIVNDGDLTPCRMKACHLKRDNGVSSAYVDDRNLFFLPSRATENHGFPRIKPAASASHQEIICFLNSIYRFGTALSPGEHFDVCLERDAVIREAFYCCKMMKLVEFSGTHVNIYPNDVFRG